MLGREDLVQLLQEHGGNVAQVARAAGKHRQQVYRWLKRYKLDASDYRPDVPDSTGAIEPVGSAETDSIEPAGSEESKGAEGSDG